MENRKSYTFLNMKKCVGNNGNPYVGCTLDALVVKPTVREMTTKDGQVRKVLNFSTPISSRAPYIAKMCGMEPTLAKDGETVWARVSAWDKTAERLSSLIERIDDSVVLIITGAIKVEASTAQNGTEYHNVNITVDDFTVKRTVVRSAEAEPAPAEAKPEPEESFVAIEGDEDLPF